MNGKAEESTPNYITYDEMSRHTQYLREDIQRLRKAMKLLIGLLVDKKIVGEQTAKAFSESNPEILEWFVETKLKKEE